MKSRRVHRVRRAQKQAEGVVATYRTSSRGLLRVFSAVMDTESGSNLVAARRAAHHLAEVESMLPRVREAIRSGRYPGAEKGDATALIWGLWGQLSEASLRMNHAVKALETIGRKMKESKRSQEKATSSSGKKAARKKSAKKRATPKKKAAKRKAAKKKTTRKKAAKKKSTAKKKGSRTARTSARKTAKTAVKGKGRRSSGR